MVTFHTAISSKLTSDISTTNGWSYSVQIVQAITYDTGKIDNEVLLIFGKNFNNREDAERFVKSKQYRKVEKAVSPMQVEI